MGWLLKMLILGHTPWDSDSMHARRPHNETLIPILSWFEMLFHTRLNVVFIAWASLLFVPVPANSFFDFQISF